MANLNDFKLVALKSEKMFEFINAKNSCSDVEKGRLGFYHLVLENITGVTDVDRIQKFIIDSDYNRIVFGKTVNDLGMDAVNIIDDDESSEVTIQLFNFKYREKFNADRNKEEGALSRSTKYLEYILSENDKVKDLPNDIVRTSLKNIRDLLNSNTVCNLVLYMVSNDAKGFSVDSNDYIQILENSYGMKIQTISLDDIVGFIIPSSSRKKSKFIIGPNDFLSFEKDNMSTQKSYVLKMSLADLVRITCDNEQLGLNYNIENDESIYNERLDYALLFDNVRGYLGETNYNLNIIDTLVNNYEEFFMLNNGLTITASVVDVDPINSGNRYLFTISDFQIVNGGQTIRSVYNYLNMYKGEGSVKTLRDAYVLVRIFKISAEDEMKNRIAEYTNSQNAIASSDLKSVDKIQIQIENYLRELGILYIRKAGQLGEAGLNYSLRISKEKTAQILYSAYGFPDRASNQKRRLFKEYYNDIFKNDNFTLEGVEHLIKLYYRIEKIYEIDYKQYNYFELKNYYVIYLISVYNMNINDAIQALEDTIIEFEDDLKPSRLLLKNKFKQELQRRYSGVNNQSDVFTLFDCI